MIDKEDSGGILIFKLGFVPCLKGEVPDVKKVKPSLQASMPSEGFLFY